MTSQDAPKADEEDYNRIFRLYFRRLARFIDVRLNVEHRYMAEDLAQQTFIELWQDYIRPGRLQDVERVYPLLATMARFQVGTFYATRRNTMAWATDFGDPINAARAFASHAYVETTPHLAALGREFDTAMAAMTEASKDWRDKDKVRGKLSRYLNDDSRYFLGGLTPETKARMQADLGDAETAEAHALNAFRSACEKVGALRAELDNAAGGNWRSASGLPISAGRKRRDGSLTSDPNVTHCFQGHLLDRDNTYFCEDGSRHCRYCQARRMAERSGKDRATPKRPARPTTSPEVIEAARQMLTDPAHAGLSLDAIAKRVGISEATLRLRLAAEAGARKSLRDIDPDIVTAARQMLRDPAHDALTLRQIADKAGCSYQVIKRHLRREVAARRTRLNAPLEAARAMLADPAYLKVSVKRIAEQNGTRDTRLYARLPVSELRAAAKAKAAELAPAR